MKIEYSREAIKFLDKQTKKNIARIREAIAKLTKDPPEGDIAPLQGYSDNRKRLRIGGWRIIFKYTAKGELEILLIIDIGNRGDIYKKERRISMSTLAMDTAKMIDMLPADDQRFAYEFVRKLVLAWDPDFSRVTPEEAQHIKAAEESGFVAEGEIDWDKIGR